MSYQKLKKLLVDRLPRLRELTMGCVILLPEYLKDKYGDEYPLEHTVIHIIDNSLDCEPDTITTAENMWAVEDEFEILWHDPSPYDLVSVLGDYYWIMSDGTLVKITYWDTVTDVKFDAVSYEKVPWTIQIIKVPHDLRDLDDKTCKTLISLIT